MKPGKIAFEEVSKDAGSSFRILLTPNLNDIFYWHFHPEYEIVFVEGASGTRHIGDHISRYENGDLVFIGPNIPHLNFDYGVETTCETIVVQMKEDFLGKDFLSVPEVAGIKNLFEKAKYGLSFSESAKKIVGEKLKKLTALGHFEQLVELLQIFQILATSEMMVLNAHPVANKSIRKDMGRIERIHHYVEENYQQKVDVNEAAQLSHLTTAAFCRYFKKVTRMTFTEFLNQYRVTQSKKLLLQQQTVTEACYGSGFDNLSYFNKTFKKLAGENPSAFRKRHLGSWSAKA
jgi:AraC-like DNA-binding protein/mannose-6-phosphate isomerase-like protein (cupin superfamily)